MTDVTRHGAIPYHNFYHTEISLEPSQDMYPVSNTSNSCHKLYYIIEIIRCRDSIFYLSLTAFPKWYDEKRNENQ